MDDSTTPLASLSLTHVHYNPLDPISYLCAWLALVPQGLCITYVVLIWASREAEIALMFAGQMGCEALNFALKRVIKEERPKQMYGRGYGMPSSHAQFLAYFATYLSLFLLFRHRPTSLSQPHSSTLSSSQSRPHTSSLLLPLPFLLLAASVASSRIYLSYHTPTQVLVGCLAGATSAVLWYGVTSFARSRGWISWILDVSLLRELRVKDLLLEEDLVEAGWREWQGRRTRKGDGTGDKKGR